MKLYPQKAYRVIRESSLCGDNKRIVIEIIMALTGEKEGSSAPKMAFKVGDRVIANGLCDGQTFKREKGVVVKISLDGTLPYGIKFKNERPVFHTVDGKAPPHCGWWMTKQNLTKEKKRAR